VIRPLDGVKVLDLSRLLPGPFASMLLGDLGAQVDKIEDPQGGDYLRLMPPMIGDQSGMFLALNRNKRSAVLDLKKPAGRDALLALVPKYDVLLEQFRPGVLDRLGLSHATLRAKNPRLVVCALTGYGQDGPLAHAAGHDINYLARGGVLGFQGPAGQAPTPPGFQLADVSGGLYSVIGILAALQLRDKTGEGSVVDVSMVESAMGFAIAGFGALFAGHTPKRGEEPLIGAIAPYGTYLAKDGAPISLGALEPKFWMTFCAKAGIEADMGAMIPGPHQAELKAKVAAVMATKTRAEWEAFARENDCCLEPVLTPSETLEDAHLRARGAFFDIDSPWGKLKQLRTPVTPRDADHTPPPRQGEHTDAILREAGLSYEAIQSLKESGAAR
jgi:crotonobetainyl-CoA:carnitine CoA-transferase CaiB-like acyl-CoA transferase